MISRRHYDHNPTQFAVFLNWQIHNLNAEKCDDRPHWMPVTVILLTYTVAVLVEI